MLLDQLGNQGLEKIVIFVFITSFRCFDLNQKSLGRQAMVMVNTFRGKTADVKIEEEKILHIICDKDTNVSAGFKL